MKYVGLQTSSGQPTKPSKSRTKSRPDSSKNRSSAPKKKREKSQSKTHPENKPDKQEKSKTVDIKTFNDPDLDYKKLKIPQLSEEWFTKCKTEMKPHKNARLALKALHIAGTKKSKIKVILTDISQAIESISTDKGDQKSDWKNSLWCFVSQFSELDSLELVKIYESLNKKSSDKNPKKKDEKREKHKEPKDKEQLRKERKERERRKEEHRDKLKRKLEMGDNGDVSKEKRKYDKEDSRKRKFHQRKYDNSYDKFRRTDPPSAPSMF